MHIFLLWCHQLFFISFLCFPSPFIAQVWQQCFRCTKGIESTLPLQSEGVWVSNISFTDFLGGKNHFSLREECTRLAEIKGQWRSWKDLSMVFTGVHSGTQELWANIAGLHMTCLPPAEHLLWPTLGFFWNKCCRSPVKWHWLKEIFGQC